MRSRRLPRSGTRWALQTCGHKTLFGRIATYGTLTSTIRTSLVAHLTMVMHISTCQVEQFLGLSATECVTMSRQPRAPQTLIVLQLEAIVPSLVRFPLTHPRCASNS